MPCSEIHDELVGLRPWREADAAWYAESIRDPEVQRFTTDPPTLTTEDVAAAIRALPDQPEQMAWLVVERASGERLGNIALTCHGDVGDVSYWVAAGARGRGVGSRAVALVSAAALGELGLTELRLWTHEANVGSQRVAERAGFHRDPGRDAVREVKGETWRTVAYVRTR